MEWIIPLWRLELWLRAGDMLTSSSPDSAANTGGAKNGVRVVPIPKKTQRGIRLECVRDFEALRIKRLTPSLQLHAARTFYCTLHARFWAQTTWN